MNGYTGLEAAKEAEERHLTVKDFAAEDQPREKAERFGCGVLTTSELWALVLRTGLPGKPITELAREMMQNNDNLLHTLERRTRKQLMLSKGIGKTKAIQIEAVMELIRRYNRESAGEQPLIRCSADIAAYMNPRIGNIDHEEIWVVYLSRSNRVISSKKTSEGSAVATVFDLKKILKEALLENAEGLILAHNHPSGNLKPSPQDDRLTHDCKEACRMLQINMLDHLIITAHGFYSYRDESRL